MYKITNLINGKIYVGQSKYNKSIERYSGSGNLITVVVKKYGISNFNKGKIRSEECKENLRKPWSEKKRLAELVKKNKSIIKKFQEIHSGS